MSVSGPSRGIQTAVKLAVEHADRAAAPAAAAAAPTAARPAAGDLFEAHRPGALGELARAGAGGTAAALSDAKLEIADFLRGDQPLARAMTHTASFLSALGAAEPGLLATMLEYQKLTSQDARDDRKLARQAGELSLASKAGKLDRERQAIDEGKDEAAERFSSAMAAAQQQLAIGIASAAVSIAAGASSSAAASTGAAAAAEGGASSAVGTVVGDLKAFADQLAAALAPSDGERSSEVSLRHQQLTSWLDDFGK